MCIYGFRMRCWSMDLQPLPPGVSSTKPTSCGTRPARTAGATGRGVGFYFRNVTELILFGVRGKNARTFDLGRRQVNSIATRKREHSRKPDESYPIIEGCSPAPLIELFARGTRPGWIAWGNEARSDLAPSWKTYAHNSAMERQNTLFTEVA